MTETRTSGGRRRLILGKAADQGGRGFHQGGDFVQQGFRQVDGAAFGLHQAGSLVCDGLAAFGRVEQNPLRAQEIEVFSRIVDRLLFRDVEAQAAGGIAGSHSRHR